MIHAKKMMVRILSSQLTRIFHERYFDRHFNSRRQSTTGCLCFAAEICLVMGFESFDKVKGLIVLLSIYLIKEVELCHQPFYIFFFLYTINCHVILLYIFIFGDVSLSEININ